MNGHIILCGLGKIGFSVLELLSGLGEQVIVVTLGVQPDWARRAESMAARLIIGDARVEHVLEDAGIATARAVVIATNNDLANLEVALDCRRLGPQADVVVRLYDSQLAERVKRDMDVRAVLNAATLSAPAFVAAALGDEVLRAFDVEHAFVNIVSLKVTGPESAAGRTLGELAGRFSIVPIALAANGEPQTTNPSLETVLQAGQEVVVVVSADSLDEMQHSRDFQFGFTHAHHGEHHSQRDAWIRLSPLVLIRRLWGETSRALHLALSAILFLWLSGVLVFHLAWNLSWIDAIYFTITVLTTVGFGDIHLRDAPLPIKLFGCGLMVAGWAVMVIAFGLVTDYLVGLRFDRALGRRRTALHDHIIVVGLGNVGYRVARRLRELGEPVLAIERNGEAPFLSSLGDVPVLIGDATQDSLLREAGIERARAVVAVTDDDLANFRIAHTVEGLNREARTVVRLFQSTLAQKLGTSILGVDQPLNPSQAAAATFTACALAPDVLQGFTLGSRLLMLRWLDAKQLPMCAGKTVAELRENAGILVVLRKPAGHEHLEDVRADDLVEPGDSVVVLEEYVPGGARVAAEPCP